MRISEPDSEPQWTRSALCPRTYIVLNASAVLATAIAAMLVPRELRHMYPTSLVWAPVAAFSAAALSCTRLLVPWMSFMALGLNLASLVLFFLAAYASVADESVGLSALAYAVLGAAVAGWNLTHLCGELTPD